MASKHNRSIIIRAWPTPPSDLRKDFGFCGESAATGRASLGIYFEDRDQLRRHVRRCVDLLAGDPGDMELLVEFRDVSAEVHDLANRGWLKSGTWTPTEEE